MKASSDTKLTLACPTAASRAELLQALRSTGSVRASPQLSEIEVAGLRLAKNLAHSYRVRVINKGLECGFAPL